MQTPTQGTSRAPFGNEQGSTGATSGMSASGTPIQSATEHGAARIEQLSASAQQAVGRAGEAVASTVREAGEKGEELRHELAQQQDVLITSARNCVRNHPLTSVAVAVGVGMLLRRLTR